MDKVNFSPIKKIWALFRALASSNTKILSLQSVPHLWISESDVDFFFQISRQKRECRRGSLEAANPRGQHRGIGNDSVAES